ncbi:glycoside hydrolase/phage tail family protein [Frigidibacter sp. MR17.14]|uniref:baseplate multidomain protein megatron n=1 Tax=Frigidibacter sp. MR17.14 TaxID=3126509 RepID=UPI003012BE9B
MATILFAAAGASIGAGFGGTVLGLSGAVIGRAVGATIGQLIDQRVMGGGSNAVETGRIDRFRLTGASEGAPVTRVWGRMRVGGQVIWASEFRERSETETTSSGGKGGGGSQSSSVTTYSYSVSLALALCEGEIRGVERVWADGAPLKWSDVSMRVYRGDEGQLPDPAVEAGMGAGRAPAYRGTAYVVFEDLDLGPFGNRVPQFSFEVVRAAADPAIEVPDMAGTVRGVALIPGTGEYSLATSPVRYDFGEGEAVTANQHSPLARTDFLASLATLEVELPRVETVLLVVCWFGSDLRCGLCEVRPKVEQGETDGAGRPWRSGGIGRGDAQEILRIDGRPVYGGTPSDGSVIEAIRALRAAGKRVVFYPFLLMEILDGNGQPDPWSDAGDQPPLPWRGRITLSKAPGRPGSPDQTAAAEAQVAAFFGAASAGDFVVAGGDDAWSDAISYAGPEEWSYRRFVLHCAHLCARAGGVDAFCVGSEFRGLTEIRGAGGAFPAVAQLRALTGQVRAVLGAGAKLGYAADWSEYAGYAPGNGDRFFQLDALWADPEIDFVGIDNYLPAADWRDGVTHLDAEWGRVHDLGYLQANIGGGEFYDWYYASEADRAAQVRTPITDAGHDEPWVWRQKDIRGWWENRHYERVGGVRSEEATTWLAGMKPIWFTEYGCAAIDKGANQPNKFLDPRSVESALPYFSDGRRDDLMLHQYLRATATYWGKAENNPVSPIYGGPMVDMGNAHVWAWDARPWPEFPARMDLWSDGGNWAHGHWLNGRAAAQPVENVVAEIAGRAGQRALNVDHLAGLVRGYSMSDAGTARSALQPLMVALGFDAYEREGELVFVSRGGGPLAGMIDEGAVARVAPDRPVVERTRAAEAQYVGRVRLSYVAAEGGFELRAVEAVLPDEEAGAAVAATEYPLALLGAEAQAAVERWLAEARVARDGVKFALPPSDSGIGAGDLVALSPSGAPPEIYRIDRVEIGAAREIEAVRVEPGVYVASEEAEPVVDPVPFGAPLPVFALFLDLPMLAEGDSAFAPRIAVSARPWPGSAALFSAPADEGYALNTEVRLRARIGATESVLAPAMPEVWDRGPALLVRLWSGAVASAEEGAVLNGANLFAIGSGDPGGWEVFQTARAELVGPGLYALSMRLRGRFGTGAEMAGDWPVGSRVVVLGTDAEVPQIRLAEAEVGLERHYRVGPGGVPYDDESFTHLVESFRGQGQRPLAPAHLDWVAEPGGGGRIGWIRQSRVNGESWEVAEVPLGEARERYRLRIVVGGVVRREVELAAPGFDYSATARAADGAGAGFTVSVAQLSDAWGAGTEAELQVFD